MPRSLTLLRTLGRGAHGSVHLAELRDDDDFVQRVAIKRLLPECGTDAALEARLRDEARLLGLLAHEHIVQVHGLTRVEGDLAIVMELIRGTDLSRLLRSGSASRAVPLRAAIEVVGAVADALDAAWNTIPPGQSEPLHVVHRDIKPSNVMVTPRGSVKVMDFGVARASFATREVQTKSEHLGTEPYMAPERWLHGHAESASDVFSLGVTFLELCGGGRVPRPRLSPVGFEHDIAACLEWVPSGPCRDLAAAMCRFLPEHRPTAREVVDRCRAIATDLPGLSLAEWARGAVVPHEGEAPISDTAAVGGDPLPPPRSWEQRLPWLLLMATVVGIFLLAWPWSTPPSGATQSPAVTPTQGASNALSAQLPLVAAPGAATEPHPPAVARPVPVVVRAQTAKTARVVPEAPLPGAAGDTDEPAPVAMRFLVAKGLDAETDWGAITRFPQVLALPRNAVVEVRVREDEQRWTCSIAVGDASDDVRIDPFAEGGCHQ